MEERKIILVAVAISLVLHLLFVVVTWNLDLYPRPGTVLAQTSPSEVLVELLPDAPPETPAAEDRPTAYTSVPERLASPTPPDRADFLSLHDSRAADLVAGGDDVRPAAPREEEIQQVEIRREELTGAGAVAFAPVPLGETGGERSSAPAGEQGEAEQRTAADELGGRGGWPLPPPSPQAGERDASGEQGTQTAGEGRRDNLWSGGQPSILKEGQPGQTGDRGFDFNQLATGSLGSGVSVVDNFSLNTYAWDWAPWMERFGQQLRRNWMAPYAYRIGVIHGQTVVRLVIERNGAPSSMEILETEGHQSLHEASLAALRSFQPYSPLPEHFPEENLVIILSLIYPAWRQ